MKVYSLYVCASIIFFCSCNNNEQNITIHFLPLQTSQFNFSADTTFTTPKDSSWKERKRMHDSCMGETFAANAVFLKTKDTFRLGCIVNTKTMKIVDNFDLQNMSTQQFSSLATFMTKPCYDKMKLNLSPTSFLNQKIALTISGQPDEVNNELSNVFNNSEVNELEMGSWINMELTDQFGKVLDTTTNEKWLAYKKILLDTTNMILVKSSSITDVSFYITAAKPLSAALQKVLATKPSAMLGNTNTRADIFLITNNRIQVSFRNLFQVVGQFMQCKLE